MLRKICALTLALTLLFTAFGCSSVQGSSEASKSSKTSESSGTSEATNESTSETTENGEACCVLSQREKVRELASQQDLRVIMNGSILILRWNPWPALERTKLVWNHGWRKTLP